MTVNDKCLVCSSRDSVFKLKCRDNLTGRKEFDIFKCRQCGFMFTGNPPSEKEIQEYYNAEEYISHSDTRKGLVNTLYHYTRELMLSRKWRILTKATGLSHGSLLDIGCGTGYFAAFMKEKEWDVTGVEPNEKALQYAVDSFSLRVVADIDNPAIHELHFDSITLWHVLEHFHDPVKYISFIRHSLKPGACCIVALPNSDSYDAKHYQQHWAAWDVPRHLWHFSPDTISSLAENNGFKVTRTYRMPADVFYISILSETYRGTNLPFITGIIKGLWFSLLTLLNKKGSSSLIYVLESIPSH